MSTPEHPKAAGVRVVWADLRENLVPWIQMLSRETSRSFVLAGESLDADSVKNALIENLAEFALRIWPRWSGMPCTGWCEDARPSSSDVFHRILHGTSGISDVWLKRALRKMSDQAVPRVRGLPLELEAEQLVRILGGPLSVAGLWHPEDGADPNAIASLMLQLEGFVRSAQTPLFVAVPSRMRSSPAVQRFGYASLRVDKAHRGNIGNAHPGSPGELKLKEAITADPELRPLFSFNQSVSLRSGITHLVDALWRGGRLVIEIDGWSHLVQAQYEADLTRDSQLMAEGFVVLRILHARAVHETRLTLEEVRNVVHARLQQGMGVLHGN